MKKSQNARPQVFLFSALIGHYLPSILRAAFSLPLEGPSKALVAGFFTAIIDLVEGREGIGSQLNLQRYFPVDPGPKTSRKLPTASTRLAISSNGHSMLPQSCDTFGAGFGTGLGFLAGLETPKLIRKNPSPLRNESSTLIVLLPFQFPRPAPVRCPNHDGKVLAY
jgi:hypothetical protein